MAVTVIPTAQGNGGSGLMNAFSLWNQFAGPQSKQNAANLAQTLQQTTNAAQAHDVTAELRGPNLDTAKAQAAQAQAQAGKFGLELGKASRDEANVSGGLAGYAALPDDAKQMTTQELYDSGRWPGIEAHYRKFGATDMAAIAKAHNATVTSAFGKFPRPQGSFATDFSTDSQGNMTQAGGVLPDLVPSNKPSAPAAGATPAIPNAAAPAMTPVPVPGLGTVPLPSSVTPLPARATPATSPSANPGTLPDVDQRLLMNPRIRAGMEAQLSLQEKAQALQKNTLEMQKQQRDVDLGIPEERQKQSDFNRNVTELTHRLTEMEGVVNQHGNYPYGVVNPEASARLKQLPMMIADNWNALAGQQGVIRPGTVELAKEDLLPMPHHFWTEPFTPNKETLAGITGVRNVVSDYVRANENAPNWKTPSDLSFKDRQLVGATQAWRSTFAREHGGIENPNMLFVQGEAAISKLAPGTSYLEVGPNGEVVKKTAEAQSGPKIGLATNAPPVRSPTSR